MFAGKSGVSATFTELKVVAFVALRKKLKKHFKERQRSSHSFWFGMLLRFQVPVSVSK